MALKVAKAWMKCGPHGFPLFTTGLQKTPEKRLSCAQEIWTHFLKKKKQKVDQNVGVPLFLWSN